MKWKSRYIRVKRYSRKLFKCSILSLLFLLTIGYVLFKSSWVQTYVSQKISAYLSEKTNTNITVGQVDFRPFETFVLNDLLILDHHHDTLLYSHDFYFVLNNYNLKKNIYQFDLIELNDSYLNIKTYANESESNLNQFLNKLSSDTSKAKSPTLNIYVEDIALENIRLNRWDYNSLLKPKVLDLQHLKLTDINMDANDFVFKKDLIGLNTELLAFKERSGFELLGMQGRLLMDQKSMVLKYFEFETNQSDINGDIGLEYDGFESFSNFLTDVRFDTYFEETTISSKDIAYFTSAVEGLNRKIIFQGDIKGSIDQLDAQNLKFAYGDYTKFYGNVKFDGLATSNDPTINAEITDLVTYRDDIKNIPLLPFTSGKKIKTPKWLENFGKMKFTGKFVGPTSNFKATGIFETTSGTIKTDIFFRRDSNNVNHLSGKIKSDKFDLGRTINNSNFGFMSLNGELDALAQFENNRIKFSGDIPRIDYKGYSYNNINMDGVIKDQVFNGKLSVNDKNLEFDFDGSVDFSIPNQQKFNFVAELKKANITKINWANRDTSAQLSGKLRVNLSGKDIEDINGDLTLRDLTWKEKGKVYKIDSVTLNSIKEKDREMITLKSDVVVAKIEGNYNLKEIYPTIINVFSKEVPSLINTVEHKNHKGGNKFSVMVKLNDYKMFNELFTPTINFSNKTRLSGRFDDSKKSFVLNFAADSIRLNNKIIQDIKLYSNNRGGKLNLVGKSKYIQIVNKIGIENFTFNSNIQDNLVNYKIGYQNNNKMSTYGDINGALDLSNLDTIKLGVNKSAIVYRDSIWQIDTTASVSISKDFINIKNFNLFSHDQFLNINGIASLNPSDSIVFSMNNFQLGGLQYFWSFIKIDLNGNATGNLKLNGAFDDQLVNSNLKIEKMNLNTQKFGDISIKTDYKKSEGIIKVELGIANTSASNKFNTVVLKGDYYPFEQGKLDMVAMFKHAKLKFMEKYFEGVFSNFRSGKTTGDLAITGNIGNPVIDGKLNIKHFKMKLDYLNVDYTIENQTLLFKKDKIIFDDFTITHDIYMKSKARVNGIVDHNGFKDLSYKLDSVILENFYCLNTTLNDNSTYYGQAFVNGILKLKGDTKSNYIGGSVSTTPYKDSRSTGKTELVLPLDQTDELEISEFVSFVNLSDTTENKKKIEEEFDLSGLDLDFNFKVNPEASVRIIFDPAVGDEISARGFGAIGMAINSNGKFNMYGDFTVTRGNYFFTLQNIIGKKFTVEPGSTMSWDGNPLDAKIAMRTYYRSRANLINLIDTNKFGDLEKTLTSQFDNRIPVNTNLGLFGSLWKPELRIGVSLPNGTPEEVNFLQERVYGDDEINRQAFSLILTSQFLPPSDGYEVIVSDKAGLHNGMQFVEGQINNALSNIWNGVDLGVDYNEVEDVTGENLTKDELRLLAGFQYKNLSLKTDYDINNQVGDIEAEFKINDALKAKAYHKTTNDAALSNQTTTTFGLGAAYQKSFNSFKELFRRKEDNEN
jgi:hypothetical protein